MMASETPLPDNLLKIAAAIRALGSPVAREDTELHLLAKRIRAALQACDDIDAYAPDRQDQFVEIATAHELEVSLLSAASALQHVVSR